MTFLSFRLPFPTFRFNAAISFAFFGIIAGCNETKQTEAEAEAEAETETENLPAHIQNLPYNTELSTEPGVSVIQSEFDRMMARSYWIDSDQWRTASFENKHLGEIIYDTVNFEGMVMIDADLPEHRVYTVEIEVDEGNTFFKSAQSTFESIFGLKYSEQKEPHSVWILEKNPEKQGSLKPAKSSGPNWGTAQTSGGFGYDFRAGSMEDLAEILSKYLDGGFVFDETGLDGFYTFELAMDHWKPESAIPALEPLGLQVIRVERELPTLRIDYKAGDSSP